VTRLLSDIIKSNFVSFSDQKRTIKNIDHNHPKILQSSVRAVEASNTEDDTFETNHHEGSAPGNGRFEETHFNDVSYSNRNPEQEHEESFDGLTNERFSDRLDDRYQGGYQQGYDLGFQEGNEQGYAQGYALGQTAAQEELEQSIKAIEFQKQQELDEKIQSLEDDLELERRSLEPKMISIIERLVKKLIGEHELNQSTIMYLIKNGLDELELHGDLIIKVSAFDLDYVLENKHLLTEDLSEKIQVEILKDLQLNQNECIIETDMGTIDCSLGVQLQGLMKELRLIRESLLNE